MEDLFFEDKTYGKIDFTKKLLPKGDYENCSFENCDFSNIDISATKFIDCVFTACNLSMAKLGNTVFRDCSFKESKMLALHFEDCNEYGLSFSFRDCVLNHSSFYQAKVKGVCFQNCQLQETDFTQADLTQASFDGCDFLHAKFENTILEKADFRKARRYTIDPSINKIRKAKFALPEVIGLLYKHDIQIEGY